MLERIRIQRYKSLYDVVIDLEPLTVLVGPNGSGKSNICEALLFLSRLVEWISQQSASDHISLPNQTLAIVAKHLFGVGDFRSKFWQGREQPIHFSFTLRTGDKLRISKDIAIPSEFLELPLEKPITETLVGLKSFDFNPAALAQAVSTRSMDRSGLGIAYSLADILLKDRLRFNQLEERLLSLIPNVSGIVLDRQQETNQFLLFLRDRFSNFLVPAQDISDGTLRLLAFLTSLYAIDSSNIICFEEPENGIHPWLLHEIVDLLNHVSTEGINGRPVQVLITTHSPAFLNLVKPEQMRAVELDSEGRTVVSKLPLASERFQKVIEAFAGNLGEAWFTNVFGGNPR